MKQYYIVDSSVLPEIFEKVVEAHSLIQDGHVRKVSEAVKKVGISRATYYKYKDSVFLANQQANQRKVVISLLLHHQKGILSETLTILSKCNANILTINQNIPIRNVANVVLSLDISEMNIDIDSLQQRLSNCVGVSDVTIIAME